eukprot:9437257-Pyramimonas_sp.AAC.1
MGRFYSAPDCEPLRSGSSAQVEPHLNVVGWFCHRSPRGTWLESLVRLFGQGAPVREASAVVASG